MKHAAEQALSHYQKKTSHPFVAEAIPRKRSRHPWDGLHLSGRIPKKMRRSYEKSHYTLPFPISKLILKYLRKRLSYWRGPGDTILSWKNVEAFYNPVGMKEES